MSNPQTTLRWGVIGPGVIAKKFAQGLAETTTGVLYGAASRDISRAEAFIKEFKGEAAYGDYQSLLNDPKVDAVYIATPHPMHAEWAIKAARAGKHILCEKPVTLNYGEATAIMDAVKQAGVFFMEAFMYRCHPQTARIVELIKGGAVGEIRHIRATFAFDQGPRPDGRHQANDLGGGGILDVGCYPVSMMRLIAGAAHGKDFLDPVALKALGHLDEKTRVDTWTSAILKFQGDIIGEAFCAVRARSDNKVVVTGSAGTLEITQPWFCNGELILKQNNKEPVIEKFEAKRNLYAYECETVAKYCNEGQAPSPAMSCDDTLGNMQTLDKWRRELDFLYDREKPENLAVVHGGPLTHGNAIPKITLPGVDKPIARLVMGHCMKRTLQDITPMWDDYYEKGGNIFDEATIYRGWSPKKTVIGEWLKSRGVRDECLLIEKGAHTPYCWPQDMEREVEKALGTQQTDYIDIYMMHRDNLQVPVGEFVDVIARMVAKGWIRAYGFSNWTAERYDEATAYAAANNILQPICLSNHFSLPRLVNPIWPGTCSSATPEYLQWLREKKVALFPWSSQAKGFISERSAPDKLEDNLLVDGFYSDDNFQRKERAFELAAKKGIKPITLSLAYVLQQPFPTFPIIGPWSMQETRESIAALNVELTADELAWLNLES